MTPYPIKDTKEFMKRHGGVVHRDSIIRNTTFTVQGQRVYLAPEDENEAIKLLIKHNVITPIDLPGWFKVVK